MTRGEFIWFGVSMTLAGYAFGVITEHLRLRALVRALRRQLRSEYERGWFAAKRGEIAIRRLNP